MGDVAEPQLGMMQRDWDQLSAQHGLVVVHCAALVNRCSSVVCALSASDALL